jgi:phosphohistidine phosphatase
MKRLILIRHGKSSWKHDVTDEKRPLKKRGINDGEMVARSFTNTFQKPVVVWSSPAVRAFETAKIFKEKLEIEDKNFSVKPQLYTFNKRDLLTYIKSCEEEINQLMVFGHNPAMTELVNELGDKYFENIPTTGLTVIDFKTGSWKDITSGKTILHLFPKNLR